MKIAGTTIPPESFKQLNLDIARLPSRTKIDIPIFVQNSQADGPVLLLMAGLHGDEINGIEIVRKVLDQSCFNLLNGAVVCIPIINIYGFLNFSRAVPDGKDVNRSFPGTRSGSLASRVAFHLMQEVIPFIDYGIDFHTGGASRTNIPQVRCVLEDKENRFLARAFNAPFTIDAPLIPKSLRYAAHAKGKKILVYEGGESLRFDQKAIEKGTAGVKKLMHKLGMIEVETPKRQRSRIIKKMRWVRAKNAGLFHQEVKPGEQIKKDQVLGFITDPFAEFKIDITSPRSGYVMGINNNPVVNRGDALVHIGIN